jgi:hypothetical protein
MCDESPSIRVALGLPEISTTGMREDPVQVLGDDPDIPF